MNGNASGWNSFLSLKRGHKSCKDAQKGYVRVMYDILSFVLLVQNNRTMLGNDFANQNLTFLPDTIDLTLSIILMSTNKKNKIV